MPLYPSTAIRRLAWARVISKAARPLGRRTRAISEAKAGKSPFTQTSRLRFPKGTSVWMLKINITRKTIIVVIAIIIVIRILVIVLQIGTIVILIIYHIKRQIWPRHALTKRSIHP